MQLDFFNKEIKMIRNFGYFSTSPTPTSNSLVKFV